MDRTRNSEIDFWTEFSCNTTMNRRHALPKPMMPCSSNTYIYMRHKGEMSYFLCISQKCYLQTVVPRLLVGGKPSDMLNVLHVAVTVGLWGITILTFIVYNTDLNLALWISNLFIILIRYFYVVEVGEMVFLTFMAWYRYSTVPANC